MAVATSVVNQHANPAAWCRHCGDECGRGIILSAHGSFCCRGCESVFSILTSYGLDAFYAFDESAGVSQKAVGTRHATRFAVLDDPDIACRFITFDDGQLARVSLSIPAIHCASCVWLLEQLWRFEPGVIRAEVDLLRRAVHVEFRPGETTLRGIAEAIASLGYEPVITPEEGRMSQPPGVRRLYLQLGVAGFAFGNIMLFSIPRYVNGAPLEDDFQRLFDILNLTFAIPVLLFSASDYFRIAWHAIRTRVMALEIPVALGLAVLFARSVVDIATARGEGFMDSFAGLTFFLLIGRLFQQKAFARIAFDRTFRSFLPLSVEVEREDGSSPAPIERLRPGDCIRVRPQEVVPADAMLLDEAGAVDYAFISGEQTPVDVRCGTTIRAGGRVVGRTLRLRVLREVSHSHLASIWSHQVFGAPKAHWLNDVAARFGGWFTAGAITLAAVGAVAWWPDLAQSASVATAVLIVACPCALTLSGPVTLGTAMGLLGTRGFFLKYPAVALDLSRIDTVAFDKTGTLTTSVTAATVTPHGVSLEAMRLVQRLAAESVHPTSRAIADGLRDLRNATPETSLPVEDVREEIGRGIAGTVAGLRVAIGTPSFVAAECGGRVCGPSDVTFVAAGRESGWIRVSPAARAGIEQAARTLSAAHELNLLSGDHDGERSRWRGLFGHRMHFRQTPDDKLAFVSAAQAEGRHVLMIGDGLNDAGAFAAADVGMAVSDATACMTPACDVVVSGHRLADLPAFLAYTRRARHVVIVCFVVSVVYNAVGLTLALGGGLTPLASAILMPVSSLTVLGISSGAMRWSARRMLPA